MQHKPIDENLTQFATVRQLEIMQAVNEAGSFRAAAAKLGIAERNVAHAMARLKEKAASANKVNTQDAQPQLEKIGRRIMVIPDIQARPGVDFSYLRRYGQYMLEKRPDIVVCIGDFADMPSLSSYDKGKKSFEGRRYRRDIEAAQFAMQAFLEPMETYNKTAKAPYKPLMVLTLGNHEDRINKAVNNDSMLDGVLSVNDLAFEEYGWEVHDFLKVVIIEGVAFSHFFATGVMGRPASSAAAQLRVANMSCFSGHQQGKQIAYSKRADGKIITSIICGSAYEHDEDYLGPQGNRHWRGIFMLNDVQDGAFDEMAVSLRYINQKYGHLKYQTPSYSLPTADEIAAGKC
jgi:hypothetical protein